MQKPIWIFGGVAGMLCALVEFWYYHNPPAAIEQSQSQVMYLVKIAILLVCIIFGLILVRKLNGGIISIARAVFSGVMIAVVRAAIMVIAFLVLYSPDGKFYEGHKQQALTYAEKRILEDTEIEEEKKEQAVIDAKQTIQRQFKPGGYTLFAFGSSIATGLVISVLMAAFIGRNMMLKDLNEQN